MNIISLSSSAQDMFATQSGNLFQISVLPELGTIDNFLYTHQQTQSTAYVKLSTNAFMQSQFEQQLLSLKANLSHAKYQQFSQDNHSNISLTPTYQFKFSDSHSIFLRGLFQSQYQQRGTGLSLGAGASLVTGDERIYSAKSIGYLHGRQDSIAKLTLELGDETSRYKSRRALTRVLDYQLSYVNTSFDYLLSEHSYLASELSYQQISFTENPIQDKQKLIALLGVKWQTTVATRMALLLGYQKLQFEQSSFSDDSAFKWRFDLRWLPLETIDITLNSQRDFQEANRLTNSYRVVDSHQLTLSSQFNSYLSGVVDVGLNNEDIVFNDYIEEENYRYFAARINYQGSERWSVYLGYRFEDLDNTVPVLDYQRTSVSLGYNVSL